MNVVAVISIVLTIIALGVATRAWRRLVVLRREFGSAQQASERDRKNSTFLLRKIVEHKATELMQGKEVLPIKSVSQHGEDAWLWAAMDFKKTGFFVEAGASDGITFSNSYLFEAIGWKGLLVEPHPSMFEKCLAVRKHSRVVNVALSEAPGEQALLHAVSGEGGVELLSFTQADERHRSRVLREQGEVTEIKVRTETLDNLLRECGVTKVDFVSLDVEGAELKALCGFDLEHWKPNWLLIEDNSEGLDRSTREWLEGKGYSLEARLGVNDVYRRLQD